MAEASALSKGTGRPGVPTPEQSSGARQRSEKVQERRRREHWRRHRREAGEVLVTGHHEGELGCRGGRGGRARTPAVLTFVHRMVLWTFVHKLYLWANVHMSVKWPYVYKDDP
jgi:hypothetical protein